MDVALLRELHLLTAKPFIYVFNVDEGALGDAGFAAGLAESVRPAPAIVLCAQIEAEVAGLDAADAAELLQSYGQEESGLEQLVHVGFATLGLQTYLTAGPQRGPGVDHSRRGHRAQGGRCDPHRLRARIHQGRGHQLRGPDGGRIGRRRPHRGRARMEGKDYVIRDGDVVEFRFNT